MNRMVEGRKESWNHSQKRGQAIFGGVASSESRVVLFEVHGHDDKIDDDDDVVVHRYLTVGGEGGEEGGRVGWRGE